jgi:hypothetical protein
MVPGVQEPDTQASWGRLEMKPFEPKNRDRITTKRKGENEGDKKPNQKKKKKRQSNTKQKSGKDTMDII